MEIIHVGPKNFPPSHGGVEKFVFDLITETTEYQSRVFVEWEQVETDQAITLDKGVLKQVKQIKKSIADKSKAVIHFHKESFIPQSILLKLQGYNCVHTIHGCAWRIKTWGLFRILFYILDLLGCLFLRNIVFVSKEDYRHYKRIFFWKKLQYIPNGVMVNNFTCSEDTDKCVYIGRISPEKNILNLVKLFKASKKNLTIYGPFDAKNETFNELVLKELESCENVQYKGSLKFDEIFSTLKEYNTFYNISFSEGMPVSVLEAASVNLNLVLSNIPQHMDLNFPDVIYVNPNNPEVNTDFAANGNKTNKTHLEENFSLDNTVKLYKHIYSAYGK